MLFEILKQAIENGDETSAFLCVEIHKIAIQFSAAEECAAIKGQLCLLDLQQIYKLMASSKTPDAVWQALQLLISPDDRAKIPGAALYEALWTGNVATCRELIAEQKIFSTTQETKAEFPSLPYAHLTDQDPFMLVAAGLGTDDDSLTITQMLLDAGLKPPNDKDHFGPAGERDKVKLTEALLKIKDIAENVVRENPVDWLGYVGLETTKFFINKYQLHQQSADGKQITAYPERMHVLYEAAERGDIAKLRWTLSNLYTADELEKNEKDSSQDRIATDGLLNMLVQYSRLKSQEETIRSAKLLLEEKLHPKIPQAHVNEIGLEGYIPLYSAIEYHRPRVFQFLIRPEYKPDLAATGNEENPLVITAIKESQICIPVFFNKIKDMSKEEKNLALNEARKKIESLQKKAQKHTEAKETENLPKIKEAQRLLMMLVNAICLDLKKQPPYTKEVAALDVSNDWDKSGTIIATLSKIYLQSVKNKMQKTGKKDILICIALFKFFSNLNIDEIIIDQRFFALYKHALKNLSQKILQKLGINLTEAGNNLLQETDCSGFFAWIKPLIENYLRHQHGTEENATQQDSKDTPSSLPTPSEESKTVPDAVTTASPPKNSTQALTNEVAKYFKELAPEAAKSAEARKTTKNPAPAYQLKFWRPQESNTEDNSDLFYQDYDHEFCDPPQQEPVPEGHTTAWYAYLRYDYFG